jgi:hypothetical protein
MADLARAAREATQALRRFAEAAKPKTEAEYWQWLRHIDPVRYLWESRRARTTANIPKRKD